MKLTEEKRNQLKTLFYSEGVHEFDDPTFFEFFEKKHYERFLPLAKWLKSKVNFKISSSMVSRVYRADVVIRQELQTLLWPLELTIATALSNFIENNTSKFDEFRVVESLMNEKLLEPISDLHSRREMVAHAQTQLFIEDSIRKILKKRNPKSFYEVFKEMALGQKISYIRLLSEKNIQEILSTTETKFKIMKFLEMIQALRNHIAHLNPIIGAKIHFEGKTQTFNISACIEAANEIAEWELLDGFKNRIEKYFVNSLNKIKNCNECSECKNGIECSDLTKVDETKDKTKVIQQKILETIFTNR